MGDYDIRQTEFRLPENEKAEPPQEEQEREPGACGIIAADAVL
jgi:hypothetical protein